MVAETHGPLWAEDCEDCGGAGHQHWPSYAEIDRAANEGRVLAEIEDCDDCPACGCCAGEGFHEYPDFMAFRLAAAAPPETPKEG